MSELEVKLPELLWVSVTKLFSRCINIFSKQKNNPEDEGNLPIYIDANAGHVFQFVREGCCFSTSQMLQNSDTTRKAS